MRFSYYIDLYCFEIYDSLILLNLFFFTNLRFYKQKLKFETIKESNLPFDEYFLKKPTITNKNNKEFIKNSEKDLVNVFTDFF